ncbi:MAG: glycosyltransferase family 1 protein [Nevskia sp.]|nr:glycosyltransferase family 1 protein [Nevskia sp.]
MPPSKLSIGVRLQKFCRTVIREYARIGLGHPILFSFLTAGCARKAVALVTTRPVEIDTIRATRQLLVDVSEIVKRDAGTGIQRVVRNVLIQLLRNPPCGYEIRPVYASRHECYRYAEQYRAALLAQDYDHENSDLPIETHHGDVFFGLDLAAHLLPHHHRALGQWKSDGVKLFFLMHDLLPVRRPEWFNPKRHRTFHRWLRTLAIYSDSVLCVSKTTADDLEKWLIEQYGIGTESLPVRSFHLGTDFFSGAQHLNQTEGEKDVMPQLQERHCIMMVGTIEPRKGHAQALSAFEILWQQGIQVNLVIVGKTGWKVDGLISRLRQHPEAGIRLHWFENASDDLLQQLYSRTDGLLMASEAEGFGLPIIEASQFNKPLLLRDIPVFKEVAGIGAYYFTGVDAEALALALRNWLSLISTGRAPSSQAIKRQNWAESTEQLIFSMGLSNRTGFHVC